MLPAIRAHLCHHLGLNLHLLSTRPLLSHVHTDFTHATAVSMLPLPLPGFAYPTLQAPWLHAVPLLAGDQLRVVDVVGARPRDAARALRAAAEHCGSKVDTLAVDAETVACFAVMYDVALLDGFALGALHVRFNAEGDGGAAGRADDDDDEEEEEEEEEWQQWQQQGIEEEEEGDTRQHTGDERHAWDYEYYHHPQQHHTRHSKHTSKAWQQREKERFECDCVKRLVSAHIGTLSSLALHNVPNSGAFAARTPSDEYEYVNAATPPALPLLAYIARSVGDMTQLARLSVSTRPPGSSGGERGEGETMRRKAKRRVMRHATTTKTMRDTPQQLRNGRSARDGNSGGGGGSSCSSNSSRGYYKGRTRQTDEQRGGGAGGNAAMMMREENHRNDNNINNSAATSSNRVVPAPSSATTTTSSASSSSSACTSLPSPPMKPSRHDTNPNPNSRNSTHNNDNVSTTTTTTTHSPSNIHPHFHFHRHHHHSSHPNYAPHTLAKRHPPCFPRREHNPLVAAFIALTCAAVHNTQGSAKLRIRYITPPAWRLAQRLAKAVRITTRGVHISADDHGDGHHALTWRGLSPRSPLELVVDDYVLMAPALQMTTDAFVQRHARALGLVGMQHEGGVNGRGVMMLGDGGGRSEGQEEERRRGERRRRERRVGGRGRGQSDGVQRDTQRGGNRNEYGYNVRGDTGTGADEDRHAGGAGRGRSMSQLQLWPRSSTIQRHTHRRTHRPRHDAVPVSRGSGSWSRLRDFGGRLTTGLGIGRGRNGNGNGSIMLRRNEDGVAYGGGDEEEDEEDEEEEEYEEEVEEDDDEEEEGRDFEYEADDMSMMPRFVRVNRTDVAVLSGLRGQVGLQSMVQFLQLIYPSVTTTTTTPTPTPTTTNATAANNNANTTPHDDNHNDTTTTSPSQASPHSTSSWPFVPAPSPDSVVPIIRAWPKSVAHVISYTRLLLSIGCAIPGKVFIIDASASFMRELSRSPSVLRALLRRAAAIAVRGEIDLWVVLAMLRALNDVDRRQNRLRALHIERGAKTMMGDCSDIEVAKMQIRGLAEEIEMTWAGIDLMSVREVMERDF